MSLVVFPILYTSYYEVESREDFSVLFFPSFSSLRPGVLAIGSWGSPCSNPQSQQRHLTSLLGCFISLLSHFLNPFRSFVFTILHSLPPTKALPNHLLRPAQFIIYPPLLLPTLLKGRRLDLENGGRKARRCPHCGLATD